MANDRALIEEAFADRSKLKDASYAQAVERTLALLDKGEIRVASPPESEGGEWVTHAWIKQAILLYFGIQPMQTWDLAPFEFYDKMLLKKDYKSLGVRAVPHAVARYGAYLAPSVVLMPSYVNIGAYVDQGTMVDTWATVGSCAQIGKNCHISGGAGIGGVLEPLQAGPVVIEDNCFIGARAEVAEGVEVGEGSVLSMGVYLGASTTIIDRTTGEKFFGKVPPYSVIVSGSMPGRPLPNGEPGPNLYCAVIVKRVDEKTRSKTSINELLRD